MKKLALFIIVIELLTNCGNRVSDSSRVSMLLEDVEGTAAKSVHGIPGPPPPPATQSTEISHSVYQKKIIKDGRMGIKVKDIQKSKSRVDSLVLQFGGYISNENFFNDVYTSGYDLTIRIPALKFDNFILLLEKGAGEITYKNIDVRDVTEEFIDLEKRLENKKKFDKKYAELLEKARSIKDILEIQEKQRVIQEEIESTEGRLKYLNDQVFFSTLNLNLQQDKGYTFNPEKRDKFTQRFKNSVNKGWIAFVDFTLFLFKLWPFWILVALLWMLIKKYRRKIK